MGVEVTLDLVISNEECASFRVGNAEARKARRYRGKEVLTLEISALGGFFNTACSVLHKVCASDEYQPLVCLVSKTLLSMNGAILTHRLPITHDLAAAHQQDAQEQLETCSSVSSEW